VKNIWEDNINTDSEMKGVKLAGFDITATEDSDPGIRVPSFV
jgi:hypothetical protein